ncbi:MAG: hypothetical protein JWN46_1747 [Acidimicrobiales bacterium]|nr:hypothetical protein [Acidimicrobiales bacterium]
MASNLGGPPQGPTQPLVSAARSVKRRVKALPVLGPILRKGRSFIAGDRFTSSEAYWDSRYLKGGTSGGGSYGRLARFKADVLNQLVREHGVASVIEWGCGDGSQLELANYPSYLGVDVSAAAVAACEAKFADDPTKTFTTPAPDLPRCDVALSLDVTYHLVEDQIFEKYLSDLFASAKKLVVLYTSDAARGEPNHEPVPHIRHRPVNAYVAQHFAEWRLRQHIQNPYPYDGDSATTSFADFYVYEPAVG